MAITPFSPAQQNASSYLPQLREERYTPERPRAYEIAPDSAMSLADIFLGVVTHARFILLCAFLGFVITLAYTYFHKPMYEATATLRIDPGRAGSVTQSDLFAPASTDPSDSIHSELIILKSDRVAIRTLNSLSDQEFASYAGESRVRPIPIDGVDMTQNEQAMVNQLQSKLVVRQIDGTQLINILLANRNPNVASMMVNHLIAAYIFQSFTNRNHTVSELRGWLSAQMVDLKSQVETSQANLAAFEEANNIIGTIGSSNTITDRLRYFNDRLAAAQSDRMTKEAQLGAATNASPNELASLFPNPKLNSLQMEQGTLYAQYAQLSTKFGAGYPPLIDLKTRMQKVDNEMAISVQSARNRLKQEFDSAKQSQNMLQTAFDAQTQRAYEYGRNEAEHAVLQSEVATSRELYDTLRRKLLLVAIDTEVGGLNTTLIGGARVPTKPAGPRKRLVIASGTILGFFSGLVFATLFQATSDVVQSAHQIEHKTGINVLTNVPAPPASSPRSSSLLAGLTNYPKLLERCLEDAVSQTTEPIRGLRNAISLSPHVKMVLIASGSAGEGAYLTAARIAIALAEVGNRTLLVDADMSNALHAQETSVSTEPGLGDFFSHRATKLAITTPLAQLPKLSLLTAGRVSTSSADALVSSVFQTLMVEWRQTYDYVLLTCSPLLTSSDGAFLAHGVDQTILVVRHGQTRLREVKQVGDVLAKSRAPLHGIVLNDVPASAGY